MFFNSYIIIYIFIALAIIFGILWAVIKGLRRVFSSSKKEGSGGVQLAFSTEDALSQGYFLLALLFLAVTLLSLNSKLIHPVTWHIILLVSSIVGLVLTYRFKLVFTLMASLVGIMVWWVAQGSAWVDQAIFKTKSVNYSLVFVGLLFWSILYFLLGHIHNQGKKWKRFVLTFIIFGLLPIIGIFFYLSTNSGLQAFQNYTINPSSLGGSVPLVLTLFLLSAGVLFSFFYALKKELIFKSETLIIILFLFGWLIILLPPQKLFLDQGSTYYGSRIIGGSVFSTAGIFWSVIFNLMLLAELLGVIFSGYQRKEDWRINLGAFLFFIFIVVKYVDWFYTFLSKSIFFISAGVLLLIVGWLMERGRKYVLKSIHSGITEDVVSMENVQ